METFTQATKPNITLTSPAEAGLSCFSCHNRGVDNISGVFDNYPAPHFKDVSHVFGLSISQ